MERSRPVQAPGTVVDGGTARAVFLQVPPGSAAVGAVQGGAQCVVGRDSPPSVDVPLHRKEGVDEKGASYTRHIVALLEQSSYHRRLRNSADRGRLARVPAYSAVPCGPGAFALADPVLQCRLLHHCSIVTVSGLCSSFLHISVIPFGWIRTKSLLDSPALLPLPMLWRRPVRQQEII